MKGARALILFLSAGVAGQAFATLSRTAVSVHGLDTNPCTVSSPCRSFAAALTQTTASGEVVALDSGGYGTMNIAQPVSVEAAPGAYAGISVPDGADGVDIGVTGAVTLRGLTITGGASPNDGIQIQGASVVHIESCVISRVATGIYNTSINGELYIDNTIIRDCSNGLGMSAGSSNTSMVFINSSRLENFDGSGIYAQNYGSIVVRDSVFSNIAFGAVEAHTNLVVLPAQTVHIVIENCLIAFSATGIISTGTDAVVTVSRSTIARNDLGLQTFSSGEIRSLGNNNIEENTTTGSFTSTVAVQ